MKKKLYKQGGSKYVCLDKVLLELAGIQEWVDISMQEGVIIIQATVEPRKIVINGKADVA